MQTIEQFKAEQAAALEKKIQELAELDALGEIPGLSPWLITGRLYGYRHFSHKLQELSAWLAWAKQHADPLHAYKGIYAIIHPNKPETRDYADAVAVADGDVMVTYSTITRRFEAVFFRKGARVSFDLTQHPHELTPRAHIRSNYSDRYHGERHIESWSKPPGNAQNIFMYTSTDRQNCDLKILLTWAQFEEYFTTNQD